MWVTLVSFSSPPQFAHFCFLLKSPKVTVIAFCAGFYFLICEGVDCRKFTLQKEQKLPRSKVSKCFLERPVSKHVWSRVAYGLCLFLFLKTTLKNIKNILSLWVIRKVNRVWPVVHSLPSLTLCLFLIKFFIWRSFIHSFKK